MFESSSLPRKANKPVLADTIWELSHDKVDENDQSNGFETAARENSFHIGWRSPTPTCSVETWSNI